MQDSDEARVQLEVGRDGLKVDVSTGPQSLLAIGGLVSGILLSTAVLVWVSTAVPREHPLIARLPQAA